MRATPDEARATWPCPVARLWGEGTVNPNCRADACPVWRWVPLDARAPAFQAAVKDRMKELGGKPGHHGLAVAWVMENREALGLPTKPTHGFCGLGGKP